MPTTQTPNTPDSTFQLLGRLFADVTVLFPDEYLHLGHDEVDCRCWEKTPKVP
jgi:N-acetyl-beta-hexosaminidase